MNLRAAVVLGAALTATTTATTACKRSTSARRDAAPVAIDAGPWLAPTVVLDRIEVTLGTIGDELLSSRELGRQFARCLIEAGVGVVALDGQAAPGHRVLGASLTLTLDAAASPDATAMAVTIDVRIAWRDDADVPAPQVAVAAEAPIHDGARDVATVAAVDRLRGVACEHTAAQLAALTGDAPTALLADPDPATRLYGLAVIVARRPPGAAPAVAALLREPPPLGAAALGALIALGDPTAVPVLTAQVDLADPDALVRTIDAVIALGGPDADAFLQVVAAHPDAAIAARARAGLATLAKRSR